MKRRDVCATPDPVTGVPLMPKETRKWKQATTEQRKVISQLTSFGTLYTDETAMKILNHLVEDLKENMYHHYLHKELYDLLQVYKQVANRKGGAILVAFNKAWDSVIHDIQSYVDSYVTHEITTLHKGSPDDVKHSIYYEKYEKDFFADLCNFPFLSVYEPVWERAFRAALKRTDLDQETLNGIFFILIRHFDWRAFAQELLDYIASHPGISFDQVKKTNSMFFTIMDARIRGNV